VSTSALTCTRPLIMELATDKDEEVFLQRVQKLLDDGADINGADTGRPLLLRAARLGHIEAVKLLTAGGADVDLCTVPGATPLFGAAEEGHESIVMHLLDQGANLHPKTILGYTPLHRAAAFGSHQIVKMLLDKNADVNAVTRDGFSPLHSASQRGHSEVVKLLVEAGANLYCKTYGGHIAEDFTVRSIMANGHKETRIFLRDAARSERFLAFAMGEHERLGAQSRVATLFGEQEIIRMIMENLETGFLEALETGISIEDEDSADDSGGEEEEEEL